MIGGFYPYQFQIFCRFSMPCMQIIKVSGKRQKKRLLYLQKLTFKKRSNYISGLFISTPHSGDNVIFDLMEKMLSRIRTT
jgi:hypothetical protein